MTNVLYSLQNLFRPRDSQDPALDPSTGSPADHFAALDVCDEQDWDDYDSDDEDVEYPHTWHWQWEEYTSELTSKLELVMDDDGIEGALVAQSKLLANNLNNSVYIDRGGNPHAEDDSRPICATKFGVFAKHHLEVVRQSLVAHGSKCYHNNNNIDANDPLLPSYIICREDAHF